MTNERHADEKVKEKCHKYFEEEQHRFNTRLACERAQDARDQLQKFGDMAHKKNAYARQTLNYSRQRR
jgi:hypothetical protein